MLAVRPAVGPQRPAIDTVDAVRVGGALATGDVRASQQDVQLVAEQTNHHQC